MPDMLLIVASIYLVMAGCTVRMTSVPGIDTGTVPSSAAAPRIDAAAAGTLANLAEAERRGRYESGLGVFESGLRDEAGDHAGAVFAAYKDLAYAFGRGQIDESAMNERLDELEAGRSNEKDPAALAAMKAIHSFIAGDWIAALSALREMPAGDGEEDSFEHWIELASTLRLERSSPGALGRYALLQSRYSLLPDYWFDFALAQDDAELMRDSAQRCIALAPAGPLAGDARAMIAGSYGLEPSDGASMLIPAEIESIIRRTIDNENPAVLEELFPVLELADNPATLYALGALRSLCAVAEVRTWLSARSGTSGGRTAERLRYIAGR